MTDCKVRYLRVYASRLATGPNNFGVPANFRNRCAPRRGGASSGCGAGNRSSPKQPASVRAVTRENVEQALYGVGQIAVDHVSTERETVFGGTTSPAYTALRDVAGALRNIA
jgi:hypothetical protein